MTEIKTNTIDDKIAELFGVLTKQKAEVEAADLEVKKPWKTKGSFMLDVVSAHVNIQTATKNLIIEIEAALLMKEAFFSKAAENLGLEWDGVWDGFKISDWHDDLVKRAAIIGINAKKANLAKLEERLNGIVSPEQRRALEMEAIMKELTL